MWAGQLCGGRIDAGGQEGRAVGRSPPTEKGETGRDSSHLVAAHERQVAVTPHPGSGEAISHAGT